MSGHAMRAAQSVLSLTCHTCSNLAVGWGEVKEVDSLLKMCKSAKSPRISSSRGIESSSNEIDASHWSIHLIECSTSSFLIGLLAILVTLWLCHRYRVCCFRDQRPVIVEERRPSRAVIPLEDLGAQNGAHQNAGFRPI